MIWFACYIAAIVLANWAIATFGVVPVLPFGLLYAPAGVYFAGFTFTFRNAVQQTLGRQFGYAAIVLGAALSIWVSPRLDLGGVLPLWLASGVAFGLSETADALVWTPLRERGWFKRAMFLADLAGQAVDSLLFLALAFGSTQLFWGQMIGKAWCTWATMGAILLGEIVLVRWRRSERAVG